MVAAWVRGKGGRSIDEGLIGFYLDKVPFLLDNQAIIGQNIHIIP